VTPAPHPDHLPFLRAIVESPDDDLPRLVYADFLEESGDAEMIARAHFIRAQIAIETLPPRSQEAKETNALIERLVDMFHEEFYLELPLWLSNEGNLVYRRGFLDTVSLKLPQLLSDGIDLFHNFPIEGLILNSYLGMPTNNGWMAELPYLSRIHTLGFNAYYTPLTHERIDEESTPFFRELMSTPVLSQLRTLSFHANSIGDAWLVRFVSLLPRAAFANTLRELDFTDCLLIGDAGANTLATARSLDQLTKLTLKNVQINDTSRNMLRRRFGDRVKF